MAKYQSPIALPDEQMRLVGIIAAHWEWVELIMQQAVAEIMELQFSRVSLLTENIGFRSKCNLIQAYARNAFETEVPDEWKRFNKVLAGITDAYADRNAYVHARWRTDDKTGHLVRYVVRTAGGRLTIEDKPVTDDDLVKAADGIWQAGEAFTKFLSEYGMLSTSRDKSA